MAFRVFVSYSHLDSVRFAELLCFLEPTAKANGFEVSYDHHDIAPGEAWDHKIRNCIAQSQAVIVLVSQRLLHSDYIAKTELPLIIQYHKQQRLGLFWVPIGDSTFEYTELKDYQCGAGDPSQPLDGLAEPDRNRVWKELCRKLAEYGRKMAPQPPGSPAPKVYLSAPSPEESLQAAHQRLTKELQDYGYAVVPRDPLPARWSGAEPVIEDSLRGAELMVALIGSDFPPLAQGYNRRPGAALVELEDAIAHKHSVRRLLWVPAEMAREEESARFADEIRKYSRLQPGYEWRESHLQDFIQDVHAILDRQRAEAAAPKGPPTLYMICGQGDHPAHSNPACARKVVEIKNYLEEQKRKYSVLLPPVSTAALDDVVESEAFIFYWGEGDALDYFWNNLLVFQKAVGKRAAGGKSFRAKVLYLTDPKLQYKSCYPKNLFAVIEQYGDAAFEPRALDPYL